MRNFLVLLVTLFVMVGCGRKEPPQAIVDAGAPEIVSLKVTDAETSKKLDIQLAGGAGGVGYQIDRAEMDPYCKCPTLWIRYYEEPPLERNHSRVLEKMLRLELADHNYVYRLRAIDAAGRLGAWQRLASEVK